MESLTLHLHSVFEALRTAVYAVAVLIILWGVIEAAWSFLKLRTVERSSPLFVRASSIRERLGVHLLLALDVFIGADLIATVLHPDWASVGLLGAIVAIRVVLSLLLSHEISEAHRLVEQNAMLNEEDAQ